MNISKTPLIAFCFAIFTSVGCSDPEETVNCEFDQTAMLTNYADNLIVPAFGELKVGALLMEAQVDQFVASPSEALLVEVQIIFGEAYRRYQRCSMYGMGPAIINGVSFRERLNTYPTSISNIENNITSSALIIVNNSRSTVGFPAIEYLLFGEQGMSNADVSALFSGVGGAQRGAYLQALAAKVKLISDSIYADWDETYRDAFVANTGTSEGSSIALLVNELNLDFEIRKNFGFKIPLGKFNGGVPLPQQCEGYHMGFSAALALANVEALFRTYSGTDLLGANNAGLDDFVECTQYEHGDQLLFEAMSEQFQQIQSNVSAISDPMSETLFSDYETIDQAYQKMAEMLPMIKREMPAALGVKIAYQDADGD